MKSTLRRLGRWLLDISRDRTSEALPANAPAEQAQALYERLSIATQAAGIYVWKFDWKARELTWDETKAPLAGAKRHAGWEMGTELFKWVHPDDLGIGAETMIRAFKDGESDASFRYRLRLADGSIRHIQAYARTTAAPDGSPSQSLGVSWDVTKEVEAADRLRQQATELDAIRRRLERAALSTHEGHWEFDLLTGKHWASSSYYALLGYPPDASHLDSGEKVRELLHPDEADMPSLIREQIENGVPYEMDMRLRIKDGSYRWFRLRGLAERDATGSAVSVSGSIHDIHEQREAEGALLLARSRFERAIRGTQDGLWEWDLTRNTLWVSPRYEAILGYAEGEIAALKPTTSSFIHPDDIPARDAARQAHLESNAPYDLEVRYQRKDGEYRWVRIRAEAARDASGIPLSLAGSIQDVTEAHAAHDALIQASQAAQAASQSKSAFLANVSHEIRTPMNGIIGMTSLLLDTSLDRTQREYTESIRSSADSLLTIINDILDFSKIEAGKLDIEAVEMELTGNIEDIGSIMSFQAAAKNLELIVNVHPDVPERVIGDPQRIRQCLINLLGNAIKFTRAGEVVIEVSQAGERNGRALTRFEVRDTGIGIAPDTLRTLFQPFVQADSSTTRHFGGTGLGLSIVRRLIEMMGGEVGVESELQKGSSFWFVLPLETVMAPKKTMTRAAQPAGGRVLIADDNATNRKVLESQLTRAGYSVSVAVGGREALTLLWKAIAESQPYDVVLADFQMPDMDGAMLGEQINGDPQLSRARVVLLTSMDRHEDIRRFASLGFAGYLSKPVRPRELLQCLDKVLARSASEWQAQTHPMVTRTALQQRALLRKYRGQVLLVEDNVVNQKVGSRFLERLGCTVLVAENGEVAVEACRKGSFNLVLMDLQMPVMDGYTATHNIRDLERGRAHTPIVALTASAMTGQLERCLDAGMDGLLTKPLDIERLQEVLDRFKMRDPDQQSDLDDTIVNDMLNTPAPRPPLDLTRLRANADGDESFVRELADSFVASNRELLADIRTCIERGDRESLARAAHSLKGASANMCAEPLRELSRELELKSKSFSPEQLAQHVEQIASECERVAALATELTPPGLQTAVRA